MSEKQRESLNGFVSSFFLWMSRFSIGALLWFGAEMYHDFQNMKSDVQQVKETVSGLKSSFEIIKDYDLRPKK